MSNPETFGLAYDVNKVVAIEQHLRRPIGAIVQELQSEGGASMTTLRALVAGGRITQSFLADTMMMLELPRAGALIDEHGTPAVSKAVGERLGEFLRTVSEV